MVNEGEGFAVSKGEVARSVRVLHSVYPADSTGNPFVNLLVQNLPSFVQSYFFSWKSALLGRYDVLHFQWPEKLVHSDRRLKALSKQLAFLIVLLRLRASKTGVVQTVHNVELHENVGRVERKLLELLNRWTDVRILLSGAVDLPARPAMSTVVIPHGDYRQQFPTTPTGNRVPGRLLYFGLVRAYKQVPALIQAFGLSGLAQAGGTLHIVGSPWTDALAADVRSAAQRTEGVTAVLEAVEETELASAIVSADLVVLPYERLYNSGAVLFALTLGRPVLVPSTPTTEEIAHEVGDEWVLRYRAPLTPETLRGALSTVQDREFDQLVPPDLGGRDWKELGERYAGAYLSSIAD